MRDDDNFEHERTGGTPIGGSGSTLIDDRADEFGDGRLDADGMPVDDERVGPVEAVPPSTLVRVGSRIVRRPMAWWRGLALLLATFASVAALSRR